MDRIYAIFLDWLFPKRPDIAAIERLSPAQFKQLVSLSQTADLPSWVTSLYRYKDPLVRKALWALKYNGNTHVASLFAVLLAEKLNSLTHLHSKSIFIPLPSSIKRKRERGWNQAELIAIELIKYFPKHALETKALVKIKHTVSQTKLSRSLRQINLKNCFAVQENKKKDIENKSIILIDDVVTTGSTLSEARDTLLQAGAKEVIAFTIAH